MYKVREYITGAGLNPFRAWLETLDQSIKARVQARIFRFETGNLGDHKSIGKGIYEARLHFGSGHRIYFGVEGRSMILLLVGGDKSSQDRDIKRAQEFWKEYMGVRSHGQTE